ncbi:N-acetylmuramate/N-acetylglucosamine kinase [Gammaproteobacteria bacterium]
MPQRLAMLSLWLESQPGLSGCRIEPASGDASFRRYFRLHQGQRTWIAMDAPPEREDCRPFVAIAEQLAALGLNVPMPLAQNLEQGFLLLNDLGRQLYLEALNEASVERLYGDALGALAVIQACGPRNGLPPYDRELLMREMGLFREWLLGRLLGIALSPSEEAMLSETFTILADNALTQPQVCVHRDYHSRNLMVSVPNPGILDFQDAVVGPVTYDLVSLLRDCYIAWPRAQVEDWALGYRTLAIQSGVFPGCPEAVWLRWFDLMGVQRHLKASGIFARLDQRDGKPGYLKDIPRTLGYIGQIAAYRAELVPLWTLIENAVLPPLSGRVALWSSST